VHRTLQNVLCVLSKFLTEMMTRFLRSNIPKFLKSACVRLTSILSQSAQYIFPKSVFTTKHKGNLILTPIGLSLNPTHYYATLSTTYNYLTGTCQGQLYPILCYPSLQRASCVAYPTFSSGRRSRSLTFSYSALFLPTRHFLREPTSN
jgi:hypothetical protein